MSMHYQNYRNKVVIITGASFGIGKSLALQLSEQGAHLVLAARSKQLLDALKAQCESLGGRALVVPTDVSVPAQCHALVQRAAEHYGRIDTLVNNAGVCMIARFEEVQALSLYEQIMRVNYLGSVYCTHYCLPYLKQSRGHVVAITSLKNITFRLGTAVDITLILPDFVSSGIHERSVDGEGCTVGEAHGVDYERAISPDECARLCIRAMLNHEREAVLSWRGRIGQWVKLVAPRAIDLITKKAIEMGR